MSFLGPLRPIVQDPALALAGGLLVLFGAHVASLAPQVSALAVTEFGLGDTAYSVILVLASVIAVTSSVVFGILADQRGRRRPIALISAGFLTLGTGLMSFAPSQPVFILATAVLLPMSGSLFGQVFALGRLAASVHPPQARAAIQTTLRALFALPWIVVLPIWSLLFQAGVPVMAIYPVCLGIAGLILVLVLVIWPRDGATRWPDPKSGLKFRQALAEMSDAPIIARVLALGAVNAVVTLYLVVIGLIFLTVPGRGAGDVAIYAGLVAGLEVPLMLALPWLVARVERVRLIVWGVAIYCVHLAFLPFLAPSWMVWLLPIFGAAGGAVILTQPMAYLQDLMGARPGAGASLLSLQKLIGDTLSATVFALGAALAGYEAVVLIGSALAIGAALFLRHADRLAMRE